jgi:hypothetical protein
MVGQACGASCARTHIELVSKDEDFSLQRSPRSEQSDHDTPD